MFVDNKPCTHGVQKYVIRGVYRVMFSTRSPHFKLRVMHMFEFFSRAKFKRIFMEGKNLNFVIKTLFFHKCFGL